MVGNREGTNKEFLSTICITFFILYKRSMECLEKEIIGVEQSMIANDSVNLKDLWTEKTNLLSSILNERVKGALVRSRFLTVRDMDAPTSFFFNLERKKGQEKLMYCLKDCDGETLLIKQRCVKLLWIFIPVYMLLKNWMSNVGMNCFTTSGFNLKHTNFFRGLNLPMKKSQLLLWDSSVGRAPGIDGLSAEIL